jgi:hypothetical protein
MKILHFIIFIADPGSRIGSSYFYRGSGIPDPDPFILSRILDPRSSYFYRGSWITDPLDLSQIYRESESRSSP